ncbi:MAG: DNA polymerase III subunit gamma and tau, partial [Rothia aeria]
AGANTESGISYDRAVALLGYTHAQLLDNVIDAFSAQDAPSLFEAVSRVVATGQDPRRFVEDLLERLRDLIVVQAVPQNAAQILQGVPADQIERLKTQAQAFATVQLTGAASTVNEVLNSMTGATNPQLQLELLCARLLVPAEDTTGLIARLESLEQRIAAGGAGSSPAAQRGAVPSPNRTMAPGQNSTGRAAGSAGQQANSPSGANPQPATPQAPVHTGPVFSSPTPGDEQPQPGTSHDGADTAGSAPSHGQHQQQTTHTPQPPRPMQAQGDQGTAHRTAGAPQQRQTARNGEGASDPLLSVRGNWRVIVGRVSDRSVTEQLLRLEPVRYTNGELYVRADMPTLRAVKASVTELSERVSEFLRVKVRVRAEVAKKTPRDDVKPAGNQTGNSPAAPSSQGAVPSETPTSTDTSAIADGPRGGEDAWRRHGQPVQPQGSGQDQPAATSVDDPLSAWQVAPIPQEDPASPAPEPENPKEPGAAEGHPKNTGNTAPNRAAHTQAPTTAASTSTRGEETQTPAKGTTPQQAAQGASQSFAESAYADSPAEYPAPNDHDVPPEDPYFPPAPDPDVHGAGAHSAGDAAVPPLSGPFEEQGPQEPAETPPEDTGQEPQQPFGERDSFASSTPAGVHTEKAGEPQNSAAEEEEKEESFGSVSAPEPGQDWAPVGAETLPGGAASDPSEDETTSGQPSEPEHSTAPASKSVFAAAFEEEENFETSADDEQVESSVHVGLKAVEKILGGKLIDETPL